MQLKIYVCPTPGCGNYYGSSGADALEASLTGVKVDDRAAYAQKHGTPWRATRAECPDCRDAGRGRVMRVPVLVDLGPPPAVGTPDLPGVEGMVSEPVR